MGQVVDYSMQTAPASRLWLDISHAWGVGAVLACWILTCTCTCIYCAILSWVLRQSSSAYTLLVTSRATVVFQFFRCSEHLWSLARVMAQKVRKPQKFSSEPMEPPKAEGLPCLALNFQTSSPSQPSSPEQSASNPNPRRPQTLHISAPSTILGVRGLCR